MKEKYIVSACLIGYECKYDGGSNYNERIDSFFKLGILVPVCPEVLGGLDTPRTPAEISGSFVVNKKGMDVTEYFVDGANQVLDICKQKGIKKAILKESSPSCGSHTIYDGTFTNTKILGEGVTAKLLKDNGIEVFSELEKPIYDAIVVMAGKSTRTGTSINKIFEYSLDKSCLEASIEPFLTDIRCNKVYIAANKNEFHLIKAIIDNPRIELIEGGDFREQSVFNCLKEVTMPYVLIHDGARPYIKEELVDRLIANLHEECAIVPFVKSDNAYDYQVDGRNIQTPQAYDSKMLLDYMKDVKLSDYRDESSIVSQKQIIEYIEGDLSNTKLTDKKDIFEWRKHKDGNSI